MKGRRLPDSVDGRYGPLQPGDYVKITGGPWAESRTGPLWILMSPNGHVRYLNDQHTFEEHADGSLTVSPSIAMRDQAGNDLFHGYLKAGVWSDA